MNPRFIKTLQQLLYRLQAKLFEMYPSLRFRQPSVMTTFTDLPNNSARASLQQAVADEGTKKRVGSGFNEVALVTSAQHNRKTNNEITLTSTVVTTP